MDKTESVQLLRQENERMRLKLLGLEQEQETRRAPTASRGRARRAPSGRQRSSSWTSLETPTSPSNFSVSQ